eukprot:Skav221934  [mRNA]  locus=scaffold195:309270:309668:+ [translate_table: standard]
MLDRTVPEQLSTEQRRCAQLQIGQFRCAQLLAFGCRAACPSSAQAATLAATKDLMKKDLKETMGYQGFIMSDWWALHSFSAPEGSSLSRSVHGPSDKSVDILACSPDFNDLAGLDQEMPGNAIEGRPMNQAS